MLTSTSEMESMHIAQVPVPRHDESKTYFISSMLKHCIVYVIFSFSIYSSAIQFNHLLGGITVKSYTMIFNRCSIQVNILCQSSCYNYILISV